MKICIVCDVLAEENNGTTIAAMNLIRSLKAKGHEVRVICPDTTYHKGEEGYYFLPTLKLIKPLQNIVDKNNVIIGRPRRKIFKKVMSDCDVVHVMFPLFIGPKAARYAKKKLHKPLVCAFHAQAENVSSHLLNLMDSDATNNFIYKTYYRTMYKYCDAIHYPTQFIKDVFENAVKKETNGYVISNGVLSVFEKRDTPKPEVLKDKKVILFTGRIAKEKSHKILIEGVAKSKYKDSIQLIFAGQGPRLDEVMKFAEEQQIIKPIVGFYTRNELVDIINYSDLYVHPAEVEIEAISCIEAITCGKVPVIANSPKSATKAFALDDRSLFEVNNPVDLAKKIDYWFDNPEELKLMGEKYAETSSQFNFDNCMDRMEQMFLDTIEAVNHEQKK